MPEDTHDAGNGQAHAPPADVPEGDDAVADDVGAALDAEVDGLTDDEREAAKKAAALAERYASPPGQLNMTLIEDFCAILDRKDVATANASGASEEAARLEPLIVAALESAGVPRISKDSRTIAPKHDVALSFPSGKPKVTEALQSTAAGTQLIAEGGEPRFDEDGEQVIVGGIPQIHDEGEDLYGPDGEPRIYEGDDLSALVKTKTEFGYATLAALVRELRDKGEELPEVIRDLVTVGIKTSLSVTKL